MSYTINNDVDFMSARLGIANRVQPSEPDMGLDFRGQGPVSLKSRELFGTEAKM